MKRPTMQDVANEAGVSRALVSLVMRDSPKVSEHRRRLVRDTADRLGYRPNAAARHLAQRRTNTIGVILNDLHNPFFADAVDGVQAEAEAQGFRLLLSAAQLSADAERDAMVTFVEHRMDAIIVLGSSSTTGDLAHLGGGVPVVSVGRALDGADNVLNDDERGAELATQLLLDLGHTRIAHVDGGVGAGAKERRRGYERTMTSAGLSPTVVEGGYTEEAGNSAVGHLFSSTDQAPTAVFAANDLIAVGVLDRLTSLGYSIPGDVSVVGYDNSSVASLHHIGLTTVSQSTGEMGHLAARRAMERLDGRRALVTEVLEPKLIIRRTTAKPRVSNTATRSA